MTKLKWNTIALKLEMIKSIKIVKSREYDKSEL